MTEDKWQKEARSRQAVELARKRMREEQNKKILIRYKEIIRELVELYKEQGVDYADAALVQEAALQILGHEVVSSHIN